MGDQTNQTDPTEQYDQPEYTDEQQPPSQVTLTMHDQAVALARLRRTMVMICLCLADRG